MRQRRGCGRESSRPGWACKIEILARFEPSKGEPIGFLGCFLSLAQRFAPRLARQFQRERGELRQTVGRKISGEAGIAERARVGGAGFRDTTLLPRNGSTASVPIGETQSAAASLWVPMAEGAWPQRILRIPIFLILVKIYSEEPPCFQ